ncbi:uncharacterized protein G2W53_044958 [Senna tora]|uniref:Uncharacterized protein n=1 Tax=Senna tora TaxID=362788 RepID=A0A834SC44_9FABA|nr:uncharacterized protein G2W53_045252 [Senna tora]KAF7800536.1 uncharacterized protein G2W53_045059 [Senna tora]KAF7800613.1 uncharacterized protein G2W53_044958 [Senna tora]
MGQDEAYDTRKPPKKFQANPTCARPNHRWTTTWIAVGRRPPKINHSWVNFFSRQNLTCICRVKMIPMTQGSLPRSFKAIRVGRPVVDRVDRRPPKINHPWAESQVHMLSQIDPYDTRKPPKKFQGHPSRSPGGRPRGSPSTQNQSPMGQLFF